MFVKVLVNLLRIKVRNRRIFVVFLFLALRPTLPTDFGEIDDVTIVADNNGFFENFRDDMQRYAAYLREKFMEIVQRMREKMRHLGSRITERFNSIG